eukprot:2086189-Pleurochrysis_carterae.AAC.1
MSIAHEAALAQANLRASDPNDSAKRLTCAATTEEPLASEIKPLRKQLASLLSTPVTSNQPCASGKAQRAHEGP